MRTTDQDLSLDDQRKVRALKIFTTGIAAKVCKVAPRTISKWFDDKTGRYFHEGETFLLPSTTGDGIGTDRRITRKGLIRFLRVHGMDDCLERLEGPRRLVLYIGSDPLACERALGEGYVFQAVSDQHSAGHAIRREAPPLVVVDYQHACVDIAPRLLCDMIRTTDKIDQCNRPIVLGLCVQSTDDHAHVDHFALSMETFVSRVAELLPPDMDLRDAS